MQKTAQKRSILNKLREMTNVSGIAAEKYFNPQFQEVMENLRVIDDTVRSIATGKAIGEGDPGSDPISLKDLLKSSKSNFNRREYMAAIAELGRFHKKIFDIISQLKKLNTKVDEVHHQFLFQDLDEDKKRKLHDLKTRWAKEQHLTLIKEANIMDFFYNLVSKRGRALAFYEKRFPKEAGKLKKETSNLLARSESVLSQLISSLKEMASARAVRNLDNYVKSTEKLSKIYQGYDNQFKTYYNDNVKGFLDKIELISPTQKVEENGLGKVNIPIPEKEVPDLDIPSRTVIVPPGGSGDAKPAATTDYAPESLSGQVKIPGSPPLPTNMGPVVPVTPPDTDPDLPPDMTSTNPPLDMARTNIRPLPPETMIRETPRPPPPLSQKPAHSKFMQSLESMSQEDPRILSSYIKKYAQSIQDQDPLTAIKLFSLVHQIKK